MSNTSGSNSFPPQQRLHSSKEFKSVFANPIKSADAFYTVLARPNQLAHARLGVIVSKKNARTAIARNRLKRVVRESFRTHKELINALDVVVICKQRSAVTINKTLANKLHKHWKFLGSHAE